MDKTHTLLYQAMVRPHRLRKFCVVPVQRDTEKEKKELQS